MEHRPRCLANWNGVKLAACLGGIYLQTSTQALGIELGESDDEDVYVSQIVPFESTQSFAAIVGSRRGHHLKAWIVDNSNKVSEMESIPKQCAGFGFAYFSNECNALFVATGLGLGVARVWKHCFASKQWELVLQCKARYNRILALHISPALDLFVGTNDGHIKLCCQQWKIPTTAGGEDEVMKKAKDVIAMFERKTEIREHTSEMFLQDVKNDSQVRMEPLEYVKTYLEEWSSLFPANAIDPFAYVGEVDAEFGKANGQGKQLLAHSELLFEGQFLNGAPVYGKLSKPRGFVYFGSVDDQGMQHGYGEEHHYTIGKEVEVYRGGFKHGMRHGMCELQWKQTDKVKSSNHGLFLFAFYLEGKRHGLSWNIWHSTAPHTPFAQGKEREMRRELKTLGCIQAWTRGEFRDEFNFFCASGREITTKDKRLLNVPEGAANQPPSFQGKSQQGVYLDKYCWACTELAEENNVLVCLLCEMRVHAHCAWPSEMFQCKWHSKLWTCRRCEVMFDCTRFLARDRHGETVVVACEDDLNRLQFPTQEQQMGVALFAQRRPNAFDELMQDQRVRLE